MGHFSSCFGNFQALLTECPLTFKVGNLKGILAISHLYNLYSQTWVYILVEITSRNWENANKYDFTELLGAVKLLTYIGLQAHPVSKDL